MKQYGPIGRREQPCPDDSVSLEETILDQLDELDDDTVSAYAEFCAERIELPLALVHALILGRGLRRSWDGTRNAVARRQPDLAEALNEIVWSIDKLQAEFIEHHAAQLRSKAEQIKQEAA